MFVKTSIAAAVIVGLVSSAFAAPKQTPATHPEWTVYDSRGKVIGADPDSRIRSELRRDHGPTE